MSNIIVVKVKSGQGIPGEVDMTDQYILLTRLNGKCPKCEILKKRLGGYAEKGSPAGERYIVQDADSSDGMALAMLLEIRSVPALVTSVESEEVIYDLDEIIRHLT